MRSFAAVLLFGIFATVSAQMPECALACSSPDVADYDGCQATDNACLCSSEKFVSTTTACVNESCTGDDLEMALSFSRELCEKVGVTLTASSPESTGTAPASSTEDNEEDSEESTDTNTGLALQASALMTFGVALGATCLFL